MSILALNNATVKLIRSTQVITSVYSVVKELVENAFDANAKNIEINLTDNGLTLIEVRDDGCGISAEDVPYVAMPHYTSKISDFGDLESLVTYGFRGEALNSVCSVADVSIITKTIHDETAKLYTLDNNGKISSTELSHRFVGTTVRVKKMFNQLPVRRQLISAPTKSRLEIKRIERLLKSLSICQPVVRMSYRVNNNLVFLKPSCSSTKEALSHFVGSKLAANLEWIEDEDSEVKLQLVIPKQDLNDLNVVYEPNQQYVIVNNRPVKYKQFEKIVSERITDCFGTKAPAKKHPVYLISITVAPSEVDVNLEPNKTSVLLKNQDIILKKLDKILLDFYNLIDENVRPELSMTNTSINETPEYHDITQNVANETEVSVCKKRKLNNNQQRPRDLIVDTNTECKGKRKEALGNYLTPGIENSSLQRVGNNEQAIQNKENETQIESSNRSSLERILKTFPGPVLSDSDDSNPDSGRVAKRAEVTPVKFGHAVRSTVNEKQGIEFAQRISTDDSVPFSFLALSPNTGLISDNLNDSVEMGNNVESNTSDNAETLSQLPVVDLGEDFDISAILKESANKTVKFEDVSSTLIASNDNCNQSGAACSTNSREKRISILELWSKGHIPGLKGCTDVSTYGDPRNGNKANTSGQHNDNLNSHINYHTGFSKFSNDIRSLVMEENPGATLAEIGKIFANRWKELSSEERGYYRDVALQEKKNAEAEKKKSRNKQVSHEEADKNKSTLVQLFESMKKTKSTKKFGPSNRTTATWELTIQSVTKSFFAKPTLEAKRIIGPLTDEIWAVKLHDKIGAINNKNILNATDSKELYEQEMNAENTASVLQSWLKEEKTDLSIIHIIHHITSSAV